MPLFFLYTNMNKMNSLHHVKEHPKFSNFLQFESHSSKCVKVRAISDLRDLYGQKIQGLPKWRKIRNVRAFVCQLETGHKTLVEMFIIWNWNTINETKICLLIEALCVHVYIYIWQLSSFRAPICCGLSIWLLLLAIFNANFWVYANFFHEEMDKIGEYSKFTIFV